MKMSREYGFNRNVNARRKVMKQYAKRAKDVITAKNGPYNLAINELKCIVSNTCYCAFAESKSPVARLLAQ